MEQVLNRAREAGVTAILTASSSLEDSRANLAIAADHGWIVAAVGVHPEMAGRLPEGWEDELDKLIAEGGAVAVGECGLDAFHPDPPLPAQISVLRAQVRLARKHRLPLVLHSRRAAEETLKVVVEEGGAARGGVLHCIEANELFARAAVNAGFHLGVGGTSTYPRNDVLRGMLKRLPPERILLETDCPYLAPQAVRGKRNEPAHVRYVAEEVARATGLAEAEVIRITSASATRLFGKGSERDM